MKDKKNSKQTKLDKCLRMEGLSVLEKELKVRVRDSIGEFKVGAANMGHMSLLWASKILLYFWVFE